MWSSLRMSVLSRLAGSIAWPLRWVPLDTTAGHSAWALGPSEAPKCESGGGYWQAPCANTHATRRQVGAEQREDLLPSQIIKAKFATPTAADATGGHATRSGERAREDLFNGQVRKARFRTPLASDAATTSGASPLWGPSLVSQIRDCRWGTCNARDIRAGAGLPGQQPEQLAAASAPPSPDDGQSGGEPTPKVARSARRSTNGNRPGSTQTPKSRPPDGGLP